MAASGIKVEIAIDERVGHQFDRTLNALRDQSRKRHRDFVDLHDVRIAIPGHGAGADLKVALRPRDHACVAFRHGPVMAALAVERNVDAAVGEWVVGAGRASAACVIR